MCRPTKIYTAGQVYPAQIVDVLTNDDRCLTIWSKPAAVRNGLAEPPANVLAVIERAENDILDITTHVEQLTRETVIDILHGIFGPVVLV